jgi:putative transport protein
MNFFIGPGTAAHDLLVLSGVIASGLALGGINRKGIGLGIVGVLFTGILSSHLGWTIDENVLNFLRDAGLALFVYSVGLQVGPSFVASIQRQGLYLNVLAGSIVLLGTAITAIAILLKQADMPLAVGILSGATTSTPALAAAQESLAALPELTKQAAKLPGLGYAVAYPFGILGVNISMLLLKSILRINPEAEAQQFLEERKKAADTPMAKDIEVRNPNIDGQHISQLSFLEDSNIIITRVLQNGKVSLAAPTTVLHLGDVVRVVGRTRAMAQLNLLIGPDSDKDLREIPSNVVSRKILVTHKKAFGRTIGEIQNIHGVAIARLQRPGVEFVPSADDKIQFADQLLVVGEEHSLAAVETALGNSLDVLGRPRVLPIFIGMALGVILGNCPIPLPGFAAPIKLGAAAGPLLVALVLSHFGSIGGISWHLPRSSSLTLFDSGR